MVQCEEGYGNNTDNGFVRQKDSGNKQQRQKDKGRNSGRKEKKNKQTKKHPLLGSWDSIAWGETISLRPNPRQEM